MGGVGSPLVRRSTLTVIATLIGVFLVAGIAAAGWYGHKLTQQRDHARQAVRRSQQQLSLANQRASTRYQAGYSAGIDSSTSFAKTTHTTYADGYKEGWQAVFGGFAASSWVDGNWYVVRIDHSKYGHEIQRLVDVTPCQQMYESNDSVYVGSNAC